MTRGGKRAGSGRPPIAPAAVRVKVLGIRVTPAEIAAAEAARRKGEKLSDFVREALEQHPRTRVAIAEIEDMIRGCKLSEATAKGESLRTTETQRRTLAFVLGLLQKPPKEKR